METYILLQLPPVSDQWFQSYKLPEKVQVVHVNGIVAKHACFGVTRREARYLPQVTSCLISKLDSVHVSKFQRKTMFSLCNRGNITGYFKNHSTKHKLVCTHFDVFVMLNSNLDLKCNISEFFEKSHKVGEKVEKWYEKLLKLAKSHVKRVDLICQEF